MTTGEAGADQGSAGKDEPRPGAGTPAGEALARAERAFELGDFAEVRRLVRPLLAAEPREVADAARVLHARVSVDRAQVVVIVACLVVLAVVVARYVL